MTSRRRLAPDARTLADEIRALHRQLDEALSEGVDIIQIRESHVPAGTLAGFVAALVARRPASTQVLVNDRVDVVVAADADGVHLPGAGVPVDRVRARWPALMITRAVHTQAELPAVGAANLLVAGTVFPSMSKGPEVTLLGVDGLERIVTATSTPVLAIGGLTPDRVPSVMRAGAAGIAAIGMFLPVGRGPDALGAAAAIREIRAAMAIR